MKKLIVISILGLLLLSLFPLSSTQADTQEINSPADTLHILHPHSSAFAEWVIDGFETWYSSVYATSITVSTTGKDSGSCLADVQAWNGTSPEADIWWGGGEYNFEVARKADLLVRYNVTEDANISAYLGGWHLKDDSNTSLAPAWYAAAISGFGIMYNTEYLTAEGLTVPSVWNQLTQEQYHGHIVMADPAASGSTTATVKMLLQEFSDQATLPNLTEDANITAAWQLWAKIAGNVGEFTQSSSAVPSKVSEGTYGIGITIDYYAYDEMASKPVGFTYGGATTVSPDPAGILVGTTHLTQAQRFMDYLTSTEGQTRVGKYRTPSNKKANATLPVPVAWDAAGNPTTSFPAILPFNVSLDGALHSRTKSLFNNWFVQNHGKAARAYKQIMAETNATIQAAALAKYLTLPSNFDGTIAGLLSLDYKDTSVTGLWKTEGATNFDEAWKLAGGKESEDGGIPGFELLMVLTGILALAGFYRRRR